MKVRRVLEYEGDPVWIETVLEKSYIQPKSPLMLRPGSIREIKREEVKEEKDAKR